MIHDTRGKTRQSPSPSSDSRLKCRRPLDDVYRDPGLMRSPPGDSFVWFKSLSKLNSSSKSLWNLNPFHVIAIFTQLIRLLNQKISCKRLLDFQLNRHERIECKREVIKSLLIRLISTGSSWCHMTRIKCGSCLQRNASPTDKIFVCLSKVSLSFLWPLSVDEVAKYIF